MNALAAPLTGITSALRQLDEVASQRARASVPGADVDVAATEVTARAASAQLRANVAAARAVDDTLAALLDVVA